MKKLLISTLLMLSSGASASMDVYLNCEGSSVQFKRDEASQVSMVIDGKQYPISIDTQQVILSDGQKVTAQGAIDGYGKIAVLLFTSSEIHNGQATVVYGRVGESNPIKKRCMIIGGSTW